MEKINKTSKKLGYYTGTDLQLRQDKQQFQLT